MYVRFLSVVSLLGLVASLAVILFGYQEQISGYFGPEGSFEADVQGTVKEPIDAARTTDARTQVQYLLQAAPFETIGLTQIDQQQLRDDLLAAEPEAGLDEPITQGGVELVVVDGKLIVFCVKPADYQCIAQDPLTRAQSDFSSSADKQDAIDQAVLGLQR